MIAAHPERARKLLPMLDRRKAAEQTAMPPEYEDVPEDYVPIQQREGLTDLLRDLRTFGAAVVES
jgi:hypothetical protein